MFNFYIKFAKFSIILLKHKTSQTFLPFKNPNCFIKHEKNFFFKHYDDFVFLEKTSIINIYDYIQNKQQNFHCYQKKTKNYENSFEVMNPEFNWYEKIKVTKKHLKNYINVDNKMFKKFIKKTNIFHFLENYSMTENFFVNSIFKKLKIENISFLLNGNYTNDQNNEILKNKSISFSFDLNKINSLINESKMLNQQTNHFFKYEGNFLSFNFYVFDCCKSDFLERKLNLIN